MFRAGVMLTRLKGECRDKEETDGVRQVLSHGRAVQEAVYSAFSDSVHGIVPTLPRQLLHLWEADC